MNFGTSCAEISVILNRKCRKRTRLRKKRSTLVAKEKTRDYVTWLHNISSPWSFNAAQIDYRNRCSSEKNSIFACHSHTCISKIKGKMRHNIRNVSDHFFERTMSMTQFFDIQYFIHQQFTRIFFEKNFIYYSILSPNRFWISD